MKALTDGRHHASHADVRAAALPALRHRIILNFEAEADRVDTDGIVKQITELTPTEPVGGGAI